MVLKKHVILILLFILHFYFSLDSFRATISCIQYNETSLFISSKVVGGTNIPLNVLKSVVHISNLAAVAGSGSRMFRCSGTALSRRYVITAAHCVMANHKSATAFKIQVCFGEINWNHCSWEHSVKEFFVPRFEQGTRLIAPDIAILKLVRRYRGNNFRGMQLLPARDLKSDEIRTAYVAGSGGYIFEVLKVTIVSFKNCFSGEYEHMKKNSEICAQSIDHGLGSEYIHYGLEGGDSGGPLYVMKGGKPFLYGISSLRFNQDVSGENKGVFSNVVRFRIEINKIVKNNGFRGDWTRVMLKKKK